MLSYREVLLEHRKHGLSTAKSKAGPFYFAHGTVTTNIDTDPVKQSYAAGIYADLRRGFRVPYLLDPTDTMSSYGPLMIKRSLYGGWGILYIEATECIDFAQEAMHQSSWIHVVFDYKRKIVIE